MRLILLTTLSLALGSAVALAAASPPFVVLQIQRTHGLRSATVRIAPGKRGIITVVPGAIFGDLTVTHIDDDSVWLSDGSKVGIDPALSYPFVHRYDALRSPPDPTPAPRSS